MLIQKPKNGKLDWDNIVSNKLDIGKFPSQYIYNITHITDDDKLEYTNCEENFDYFKSLIPWINESKMAIIWIYSKSIKRPIMPFAINENLCCAWEGYPKGDTEKLKNAFIELKDIIVNLDSLKDKTISWLIDKVFTNKEYLLFMDNFGTVKTFGNYSWYKDGENLTYSMWDQPFKQRESLYETAKNFLGFGHNHNSHPSMPIREEKKIVPFKIQQ